MTLAPLKLYVAVIDGQTPADWRPFSSEPLSRIKTRVDLIEAQAFGPQYRGARISYLLREVDAIEAQDTPAIVGVLVDGSDFSHDPSCRNVAERVDRLRKLAMLLSGQAGAYYRLYGFRLWLVKGQNQSINATRIGLQLTEPIAPYLGMKQTDIFFEEIGVENLLVHVCERTAREAALRQPFIHLKSPGSA